MLSVSGRQVKEDNWHDPRLVIVHDVELPIPLYYLEPVTGEIEDAYLQLAADEQRSYNLHTDFNWEKSLPNLNPRRSEITIGWSLQVLAEGLLTRVISYRDGSWAWQVDDGDVELLGTNLSGALYRVGEIHRNEDLQRDLEQQLREVKREMGPEGEAARRDELVQRLETLLNQMNRREMRGAMSREDVLDRPVLRALIAELKVGTGIAVSSRAAAGGLYDAVEL